MPKVSETYLLERREGILEAALSCFGQKGFHQTTMRDICEAAGVSPGAVYRYFKSKDEFIEAASAEYADRLRELIAQVTEATPDAKEELQLIGEHYYDHFHDPNFFDMARADAELHAETLRSGELRETAAQTLALMRDTFASMIEKVPHPGDYRRGTARTVANLVIALWFGLQYTKAVDPDNVDTDEVFTLLQYLLTLPDVAQS
jgi:AcrR family transcriptional regulator